jgi:hypothetical protein
MSGSNGGRVAIVVGALAIATIPGAVAASWKLPGVTLLEATEVGVPAAFLLGLLAVTIARRARFRVDRSVTHRGARLVRAGRMLAWTGIYLAIAGGVALGFYGLLVVRS